MKKLSEIGKRYDELQTESEAQAAILKEIDARWAACEAELLEALVDEGVNSIKLEGIGLVSMRTTNYLNVNAADKPKMFEYLKASGNGAIIKEDVNTATLTAFLGKHLEEVTKRQVDNGLDEIEATKLALDFLKQKGANYFTKRGISLKRSK